MNMGFRTIDNNNNININNNNIIKGPRCSLEQDISLGRHLLECITKNNDSIAQIDVKTGKTMSYYELKTRSIQAAESLKQRGIGVDDVVSICLHTTLETVFPVLGALYNGAIITTLHPSLSKHDFKHLLNITKPKILFTELNCLQLIEDVIKELDLETEIIIRDCKNGYSNNNYTNFSQFLSQSVNEDEFQSVDFSNPHDHIAFLLPSSGTTGLPKCVAISHGSVLMQLQILKYLNLNGVSVFNVSTFYWISGLLTVFVCFDQNATKALLKDFDAKILLHGIEKYKLNIIVCGVANFSELVTYAGETSYDLSSVKLFNVVGGKASSAHVEKTKYLFKNSSYSSGYGLTEVSGLCFKLVTNKPNSIGSVAPGLEAKIQDLDTGASVEPNCKGELCVRGKLIMKCYLGNEKETNNVLDSDGWLHTGDLAFYDEDNCFYVIDRIKEIFKCRGWQISPLELEIILSEHPGVKDAAVISIPHDVDVNRAKAFIVKQENIEITEDDIHEYLKERCNPNKQITGGIEFVDTIPRNPNGKITKRFLS